MRFTLAVALALLVVQAYCLMAMAASDPLGPGEPLGPVKVAVTVDDFPKHGDDYPGVDRDAIARGVIGALKENHAPAWGFANGAFMEDDPETLDVLKQWLRAGFPLGNHTYSHADLAKIGVDAYMVEIQKEDDLLKSLAGISPLIQSRRVFRYPYLDEGDTLPKRDAVRTYLAQNGYRVAEVTTDYYDWAFTDAYTRCLVQKNETSIEWLRSNVIQAADRHLRQSRKVAQKLFGRDIAQILLVHVGNFDAVTLGAVLEHWRANGVQLISLDEALRDPVYRINPKLAYSDGRNFLEQIGEARSVDLSAYTEQVFTMEALAQVCPQTAATPTPVP